MAKPLGERFSYTLYSDPAAQLSLTRRAALRDELRAFAALSLDPVPDYQILSLSLDDAFRSKVIVLAHDAASPPQLVGFASAQWFDVPGVPTRVLDTGLTIVAPGARGAGLTGELTGRVFLHTLTHVYPRGHWVMNLSDAPNVLGYIAATVRQLFPSPTAWAAACPSDVHMCIARWVDSHARRQLAIPPSAAFDERSFVFRGANAGTAFMKDADNAAYGHRDETMNAFYRRLMRKESGDEVLQVGFLDPRHVAKVVLAPSFRRLKSVRGGFRALL